MRGSCGTAAVSNFHIHGSCIGAVTLELRRQNLTKFVKFRGAASASFCAIFTNFQSRTQKNIAFLSKVNL